MPQYVSVQLDEERLRKRLTMATARLLPEQRDLVVRKTALDVVAETVRALNGVPGHPKRVDTGRYRAGWRMAAIYARLPGAVSIPGVRSHDPGNPSLPSDGIAKETRGRGSFSVTLGNAVEYATDVEDGTSEMAPGHHLKRALRLAERNLPDDTRSGVEKALTDAGLVGVKGRG